jgi:hypothetical protein
MNTYEQIRSARMKSDDRIIVLRPMEGQKPKGMVDPTIFTGGNALHAIRNPLYTQMWSLKYEKGAIPTQLKSNYTSYVKMLEAVTNYYKERNIEVVEVIE